MPWESRSVADNVLPTFGTWNVETPQLTRRSRLYSLAPIGVGTREAESLTSYVARLAEAHAVELHVLMRWEVYPRMEPRRSLRRWTLNGGGPMVRKALLALEDLTGRGDLRYLTFTPWARFLYATPMLRRDKAWCPCCYDECRRFGRVVYEPLLWTVERVERCPRHGVALVSECPFEDCRARSSPLSARSRPAYCGACGRWLGDGERSAAAPEHATDAEAIVELLIEHGRDGPDRLEPECTRPATGWSAWQTLAQRLRSLRWEASRPTRLNQTTR